MKASTIIAIAAASLVSAQSLTDIPECALQCAFTGLTSTGCDTADIACICKSESFIATLTPCVQSACSPDQVAKTIQVASALCASQGVSLVIPSQVATSAPVSSALSSATEAASSSASSVSSVISSIISQATSAIANATSTGGSAPLPTNGTTTTRGGSTSTGVPAPSGTDPSIAGRNTVVVGGFAASLIALAVAFL